MRVTSVQSLIALVLAANLSLGFAAAPAVGVVTASGSFTVDSSRMAGNATLFEGSVIETGKGSSQLRLNNGARMHLAAESRGIVYRDRMILERGDSQFESLNSYQVEALTLHVRPSGGASARVKVRDANTLHVAALNGPVRVANAQGVLIARLEAGHALQFTPEAAGAAAPSSMTGCLAMSNHKYMLKDEASSVSFEVVGGGVEKHVGSRVQIMGTVNPATADSNVVQATSVKFLSKNCGSTRAGAATASTGAKGAGPAAAKSASGMSMATKAIIAGVVVVGASTGAAIAVTGDDEPQTISPSSR